MSKHAKIGLWLDQEAAEKRWKYGQNVFGLYVEEILGHAGVPHTKLETWEQVEAYRPDILVAVLSGESDAAIRQMQAYVEQGGVLISYAGLNRMAGVLGCREVSWREAAYAELPGGVKGEVLRALSQKLWVHTEAAAGVASCGTLLKSSPQGEALGAAWLEFRLGSGKLIRWNVNIPETIVWMQQGTAPVVEDGIPAQDGTGSLDEGILKADDRCELDWELDRSRTATNMPYFAVPYGDLWREALVGQLLREALSLGLTLPFIDYWPQGIEQVAMISHDSDFNLEESAEATLELLAECGIHSTWCMIEPGYGPAMYERIAAEGHELAFHYNALEKEDGIWSRDEFERQLAFIRKTTGAEIRTNKNHYTRFEGWGELFEWCEENGITGDQTRGPSKKGNIGFLFGTCHPYYPIAWADQHNRRYNVLEIGFLTQDLEHPSLSDTSVIDPFLSGVKRVRGVAHFLFHQLHVLQVPKVVDAFREVARKAKEDGFVFWTSDEIVRWEKARREALPQVDASGELSFDKLPEGAVIRIPVDDAEAVSIETDIRFGVSCRRTVVQSGVSTVIKK